MIDERRRSLRKRPGTSPGVCQWDGRADCLAGAWARSANRYVSLEAGDIEAGLQAAAAIGDDRIQRMAGRRVSPDSFTHGSSAQRVEAFRSGLAGRAAACGLSASAP